MVQMKIPLRKNDKRSFTTTKHSTVNSHFLDDNGSLSLFYDVIKKRMLRLFYFSFTIAPCIFLKLHHKIHLLFPFFRLKITPFQSGVSDGGLDSLLIVVFKSIYEVNNVWCSADETTPNLTSPRKSVEKRIW